MGCRVVILYQVFRRTRWGWQKVGELCDAPEAIARLYYALGTGKTLRVERVGK